MEQRPAADPFAGGSALDIATAWTEKGVTGPKPEAKQAPAEADTEVPLGENPPPQSEAEQLQDEADSVSAETESDSEPDDPALAPPPGWSDDEKALFKTLPREAQTAISRKLSEADRVVTSKTTELANERKQIEAQRAEFQKGLTERFQRLDQLIQSMDAKEPDWQAILESEGVYAYQQKKLAWDNTQKQKTVLDAERQKMVQEQQATQQRDLVAFAQKEVQALTEKWPEWFSQDPAKQKAIREEAANYLMGVGYSRDEVNSAIDHRAFLVTRDAMKWQALQKSKPEVEKRIREAPRMVRSGPSTESADRDRDQIRKARQAVVRNPGSTQALAGLMGRHLNK